MIATTDRRRGQAAGEFRKVAALTQLESRREIYVLRGRRALLTRLLMEGTATADDVRAGVELPPDLDPRCLGAVPGLLAKAGIIALDGYAKTSRPERHASIITVWRLAGQPPHYFSGRTAAIRWLAAHPVMNHYSDNTGGTRRKLSDILNGGGDSLRQAWDSTKAADDFAPLPAGTYVARIVSGELATAKSGTPGYKLTFRVLEGEYDGRQFWHDIWLTAAALPMAKRDLGKLGISALEQLERPLPPGIRAKCKVALRKDDDGTEYNRVRSFDVLGIDPVDDADFAPANVPSPFDGGAAGTTRRADPEAEGDATFDPAQLEAEPAGGAA